ncbi:MAG: hypothetical protein FJZ01_19865 [Candidatus Sericytochromatia bacterium]|nr:hypothetical protein [Candidatus Tanganyikabacteria bacterium]
MLADLPPAAVEIVAAPSPPAGAQPREWLPERVAPRKDPATALALSALSPLALVAGTAALSSVLRPPLSADPYTPLAALAAPLLLGTGYLYAGDPYRGALVGAGAYVSAMGGFGAGFVLGTLTGGQFNNLVYGTLGGIVAGVVYAGWALYDVYDAASSR